MGGGGGGRLARFPLERHRNIIIILSCGSIPIQNPRSGNLNLRQADEKGTPPHRKLHT